MGLTTKSRMPSFRGATKAIVPTPTFSGLLTSNAADSINPYTSQGPGDAGAGQTFDQVYGGGSEPAADYQYIFNNTSVPTNTSVNGSASITNTLPAATDSGASHAVRTRGAASAFHVFEPNLLNLGTRQFTIAFNMLVPTGLSGGVNSRGFFEEQGGPGGNPKYYVYFLDTTTIQYHINGGFGGSQFLNLTIPNLTFDTWHEFRITKSTDTLTYYWDGASVGTLVGNPADNFPSDTSWNFGRNSEVAASIDDCYFDNIRFWLDQVVIPV